jgi:hypothetical protein
MRFLFDSDTFDKPTLAGIVLETEEIAKYRLARVDRAPAAQRAGAPSRRCRAEQAG